MEASIYLIGGLVGKTLMGRWGWGIDGKEHIGRWVGLLWASKIMKEGR